MSPPRICLLAWGTRGDVSPLLALATGLRDAGNQVAVAACDDYQEMVTEAGIHFEPFGVSMSEQLQTNPAVRRWLTDSRGSLLREVRNMRSATNSFTKKAIPAIARLVSTYDAFVTGLLTADAVAAVGPRLGKRQVYAMLAPSLPTADPAAQLFPPVPRTSNVNYTFGEMTNRGAIRMLAPLRRATEARLGLTHVSDREQFRSWQSLPVLGAFSPLVVPSPPDWPDSVAVTGYWTRPSPADWTPPPSLVDFLTASPIHIGFGSMPAASPREFLDTVTTVLNELDLTATLQGPFRPADVTSERLLLLDTLPHEWLLPQVRAVVHHGGAGTTGASFRAGVPQVVVPHVGDQHFWGRRVVDLGCGPEPLPLHLFNPETFSGRLRQVLRPNPAAAALNLGESLRAEDGVGAAVSALADLWPDLSS